MPAYHFPILVCEGYDGNFLAALVEDAGHTAAVGPRAGEAVDQIRDVLEWRAKRDLGLEAPRLEEAVLSTLKVELRAEYRDSEQRSFPCQEPITLRIPCVRGADETGLLLCSLPTLGIRFSYYDADALKGLVTYYVQSELKGKTPQELARLLPPKSVSLEDVVIQVPQVERESHAEQRKLKALPPVADPMGARELRRHLSRPWERDREVSELVTLLRNEKSSILLVGESGVGKTAILAEAVRKLEREGPPKPEAPSEVVVESDVPRFWLTSASRLIAGMKYLGQWQERIEAIIAELAEIGGVLCVESLLDLVRIGGSGPGDSIAAFLVPYLQRRELRIAAEATPAELDACRRLLGGFAELFQVLSVRPLTRKTAISALHHLAQHHSQNLHVDFEPGAVETTCRLFSRFTPYQSFPGPAATFVGQLFEAAARARCACVTRELAINRFILRTGLPELFLRDDLPLDEAEVIRQLKRRVIGQDSACAAAASVITSFKAGMNDPGRPISVMLFCGPTGVGKTELARAMADSLFGHGEQRDRMVRLDMSEYSTAGSAARLLTDSTGGPSELLKRIRQQPFNLVLLDEVEKAAPEVFDVMLGLFDEGRLTDRFGRLTIFRSAVIVMTSNLGADSAEPFGLSRTPSSDPEAEVASSFRPELVNRIDAIITFQPLDPAAIRAICVKELTELRQREGLTKNNLWLRWTDALVEHLATHGFDRRYGARPLQRAIETQIVIPLSRELVNRSGLRNTTICAGINDSGAVHFVMGR